MSSPATVKSKNPKNTKATGKKSPVKLTNTIANRISSNVSITYPLTNHIAFLIDNSGSMNALRAPVVAAFNSNLAKIKEEVYKNTTADGKSDQVTTLTSVFFDAGVSTRFLARSVDTLKSMKLDEYLPNGSTALLQAVGETIENLESLPDANDKNTSFLLITITDGEENASSIQWKRNLAEKLNKCQATDRWTFVFLVPDECSRNIFINNYHIPEGNVMAWAATNEGTEKASQHITRGLSGYYTSRANGAQSVRGFFKADLSSVKKKDLKDLEDLSSKTKILHVSNEMEIKPFIEQEMNASYIKGGAFYELSKDEKVQSYKKIMIKERNGRKIYGGDDARQLLGLPDQDVKLRIENLATYQVFVQSTSVNRKLVRGTTVLYCPSLA